MAEANRSSLRLLQGQGSRSSPAGQAATDPGRGHVLLASGVEAAYQPIVHLGSGAVIAHEALARPRHPDASDPLTFFRVLQTAGLRLEAEWAAIRAAFDSLPEASGQGKLFVNVSPSTLIDDDFDLDGLVHLARQRDVDPGRVVIEVTESEAVADLVTLARRCRRLRRLGVGLAVDDAGAGHSSFRVITRLSPTYIKIDRDLVSNVDTDGVRHAFIDALVHFSRRIGARLIAEGIETEGELASLTGLGVEAGQGYFIARPERGRLPMPSPDARRTIGLAAQRLRLGAARMTAGELAQPPQLAPSGWTVQDAHARFRADPALGSLVVSHSASGADQVDGNFGVLGRGQLEHLLASPGAWESMGELAISDVAERHPLTVSADLDIAEVAAILAARDPGDVGEDIVVTDARGGLDGVLHIRDVLRALVATRPGGHEIVDPLSGLKGLPWVDRELARRLEMGSAVTVVFVDLDTFGAINELGGFTLGDEVIQRMARCLKGVAAAVRDAAVAHVGGDDFVLIVSPSGTEELVSELVRSFESEVVPELRLELHLRDATELLDRLALSMAAVDLAGTPPPGCTYLEWARSELAPLQQTAKATSGHSLVLRRGDVASVSSWSPRPRKRSVSLGLVEPAVVLGALDLIARGWRDSWSDDPGHGRPPERFPGPVWVVARLDELFAKPLRAKAQAAIADGRAVMELTISGEEQDLLQMLDRLALVTRQAYSSCSLPIPPELALIDRLLQQRSRALTREDRMTRLAPR